MKKYLLKILSVFLGIFALVCVLCGVFYLIIVDKITAQKIGENLDSIAETQSLSINSHMEGDYNILKNNVNEFTLPEDSILEKAEKLNSENLSFFNDYPGGFGGYEDNGDIVKFHFYQDGVDNVYIHNNSSMFAETLKQDFNFCNFNAKFTCENGENTFEDKNYVAFRFDDVFCYFESEPYFKPLYDNSLSIKIDNYAIVCLDGYVHLTGSKENSFSQLYTYLKKDNANSQIDNLKQKMINLEIGDTISEKIKLDGAEEYLTVSKITDWEDSPGHSSQYNMYLVQFYTAKETKALGTSYTISLLAIFIIIIIIFAILSYLLFTIIRNKYESMNTNIVHRKNYGYQIKVKRDGTIIGMDSNFKKLLTNAELYKNLGEFDNFEKHPDIKSAITGQKVITLVLSPTENVQNIDMYIRFTVLKGFDNALLVGTDDTENVTKQINYRHKALYHAISKHPNGEMFKKDLDSYIETKKARPETKAAACVAVKVKKFNSYNEIFGTETSNRISIKIGDKITSYLQGNGRRVYQLHNDYFVAFFEELESFKQTNEIISALIEEFKRPTDVNGNLLVLDTCMAGFNIDLNMFSDADGTFIINSLNAVIDKIQGLSSKQYEIYDYQYSRYLNEEESLTKDLSYAIKNHEFYLALQPQFSNKLQRVVGLESLIRWNNPKYEKKSPQGFIELAEHNGMIIQIGNFILDKAFEYAKMLEMYEVMISVNVSPVQILQAGFVSDVLKFCEKHEVIPEKIAIEVTETFLMDNYDLVVQKLNILKKEGFAIHLDDFGTGHSSLLYLKNLPIDAIKIDKGFVDNILEDEYSRTITQMQITTAKTLGLELIAEGVESYDQNELLVSQGCDIVQGYMISKPMKIDDAIKFLDDKMAQEAFKEAKKQRAKLAKELEKDNKAKN